MSTSLFEWAVTYRETLLRCDVLALLIATTVLYLRAEKKS
jgi:hypothetical protein